MYPRVRSGVHVSKGKEWGPCVEGEEWGPCIRG